MIIAASQDELRFWVLPALLVNLAIGFGLLATQTIGIWFESVGYYVQLIPLWNRHSTVQKYGKGYVFAEYYATQEVSENWKDDLIQSLPPKFGSEFGINCFQFAYIFDNASVVSK